MPWAASALRGIGILATGAAAGCAAVPSGPPDAALSSLVAAERAFAHMSVEQGVRAAFLANFADDGVNFQPAPVNTRQALSARPGPADPKAITLAWEPVAAGMARSGDFGFTTGPYTLGSNKPGEAPQNGVYFSVWKREGAGPWRVAVDIGIETPGAVAPEALLPAPATGTASTDPASVREALLALEAVPFDDYAEAFAGDGRLHRNGMPPALGRPRIRTALAGAATHVALKTDTVAIARSGDLACTWGTYVTGGATPSPTRGWYVHLWTRDAEGAWRIIVATLLE